MEWSYFVYLLVSWWLTKGELMGEIVLYGHGQLSRDRTDGRPDREAERHAGPLAPISINLTVS